MLIYQINHTFSHPMICHRAIIFFLQESFQLEFGILLGYHRHPIIFIRLGAKEDSNLTIFFNLSVNTLYLSSTAMKRREWQL